MKVLAALFDGNTSTPQLVNAELKEPGPTQVLVKMVAAGICHTDIKASKAGGLVPHPVVLGHEGAGIVARVGREVTTLEVGDHVLLTFASCGSCASCTAAEPAYCHHSSDLNFACTTSQSLSVDGDAVHSGFFGQSSFATHAIADARNTVKVRKDVSLSLLAPLACGVQTGAGSILNVLKPTPGSQLIVYGTGSVGLSAIMAARLMKVRTIVAVDRNPDRLAKALELGASHAIEADEALEKTLQNIVVEGAQNVFDTTGVPEVMYQGIKLLAPRGTFGYVTSPWDGRDVALPVRHMLWGRKMVGIIQGSSQPNQFIPALVDLVITGRLPIEKIIDFYSFNDISKAFHDMMQGTSIKPVIRFDF